MKTFQIILGIIFCSIGAFATPVAIIYGIYLWGGQELPLAVAAWSAAKVWIMAILGFIPGLFLVAAVKD